MCQGSGRSLFVSAQSRAATDGLSEAAAGTGFLSLGFQGMHVKSRRLQLMLVGWAVVLILVLGVTFFRLSEQVGAEGGAADTVPQTPEVSSRGESGLHVALPPEAHSVMPDRGIGDPPESFRIDRLRNGIAAGDSAVLQDAKRYAVLGSMCAHYASMLNHAAREGDSYRFTRSYLAERCAGLDLSIRIWSGEVVSLGDPLLRADEFVRQFDPLFSSAQSLANMEFPTSDELESRSVALMDVILKADYFPTLVEAMLAFAVDADRPVHPQMRLPFVEDLPRMGNVHDYRSSRFLGLVALQVACLDRIIGCGPNSLYAIQLCVYRDTCRSGVTVEDYILDEYSGRQIMASRIAGQRIVAARIARGRGQN